MPKKSPVNHWQTTKIAEFGWYTFPLVKIGSKPLRRVAAASGAYIAERAGGLAVFRCRCGGVAEVWRAKATTDWIWALTIAGVAKLHARWAFR